MRRTLLTLSILAVAMATAPASPAAGPGKPFRVLIITGDQVGAHKWKETTPGSRTPSRRRDGSPST